MPDVLTERSQKQVLAGALLRAAGDARVAPNGEKYDHRFLASTERVASDGGIIQLAGWRFEEFKKRPRFIASHDMWGHPALTAIGRVVDIRLEDNLPTELAGPAGRGLVAYVRYADTRIAREVMRLYDDGILSDVSVRWDPRTEEVRAPREEEIQLNGEDLRWVVTRADLVELSSVLWGADDGAMHLRGAVREALTRGRTDGKPFEVLETVAAIMDSKDALAIARTLAEKTPEQLSEICRAMGMEPDTNVPDGSMAPGENTEEARQTDQAAVADLIRELDDALSLQEAAIAAVAQTRQRVADAVTGLRNLALASAEGDKAKAAAKEDEPPAAKNDEAPEDGEQAPPPPAEDADEAKKKTAKGLDLAELAGRVEAQGDVLATVMARLNELAAQTIRELEPTPEPVRKYPDMSWFRRKQGEQEQGAVI
jgi:hypothetical protein